MKILFSNDERDIIIRSTVAVTRTMKINRKQRKVIIKTLQKLQNITGLIDLKPVERSFLNKCLMLTKEVLIREDQNVAGFLKRKITARKKIKNISERIDIIDKTLGKINDYEANAS